VSFTQELATSVALVKRKLRKPPESWHWRLPKKPGRDRDNRKGAHGSALDPLHLLEAGVTVKIVRRQGPRCVPEKPKPDTSVSHAVLMIPVR
jgi:hypothetical protein